MPIEALHSLAFDSSLHLTLRNQPRKSNHHKQIMRLTTNKRQLNRASMIHFQSHQMILRSVWRVQKRQSTTSNQQMKATA